MLSIRALSSGLYVASIILAGCVPAKPVVPVPPPVDSETLKKQADFAKTEALYYDITQQDFQQIACNVDFPLADRLVQQMRAYLMNATDGKVSVTDTLASYRLTYGKKSGLHFDDPIIDVTIKPGTKPANPNMVESGKKQMLESFKSLIVGTDAGISQMLRLLEPSNPDDYDFIYVNLTPDGYQMSYKLKKTGAQATSSLVGTTYEGKYFTLDGGQTTRTVHSKKLGDGKLLPLDVVEDGSGVAGKSSGTTTITYQTLGTVYFPAKVETQASIDSFQMSHQTVTLEYIFSDCVIK